MSARIQYSAAYLRDELVIEGPWVAVRHGDTGRYLTGNGLKVKIDISDDDFLTELADAVNAEVARRDVGRLKRNAAVAHRALLVAQHRVDQGCDRYRADLDALAAARQAHIEAEAALEAATT